MTAKLKGVFHFQCVNPDGSIAWEKDVPNGATNAGLNDLLNVYFVAGSQKTTWCVGLISNAAFSSLSPADTMATHTGWAELTSYGESVRQTWSPGSASGQQLSNAGTMNFTINGTCAIYGAFLVSDSTKGGTSGTLYSTGAFDSVENLVSGQVLKITYNLPAIAS